MKPTNHTPLYFAVAVLLILAVIFLIYEAKNVVSPPLGGSANPQPSSVELTQAEITAKQASLDAANKKNQTGAALTPAQIKAKQDALKLLESKVIN